MEMDIVACNGVIHTLSKPLVSTKPSSSTSAAASSSPQSPPTSVVKGTNGVRVLTNTNEFEWINESEIKPGTVTCGFLTAPLGSLPKRKDYYPTVQTYFCVRFAEQQPTSQYLVTHCGGPTSTSSCIMYSYLKPKVYTQEYNIVIIDQRGVGRSGPVSFFRETCAPTQKEAKGGNTTALLEYLHGHKQRVRSCWNDPEFTMASPSTNNNTNNNTTTKFHFLEYSGTQRLVEDIERFRKALNIEKLSLYGVSYGTMVMGLYSTVFPQNVDKFVIDSNCPASSDLYSWAYDFAQNAQELIGSVHWLGVVVHVYACK